MGLRCNSCGYIAPRGPKGYDADCPKCGARYPPGSEPEPTDPAATPTRKPLGDALAAALGGIKPWHLLAIVAVGAIVYNKTSSHQQPAATQRVLSPQDAYAAAASRIRAHCHSKIESALHDPTGVMWDKEYAIDRGDAWEIRYQFRAKNAFNAYRLTAMKCTIAKGSLVVIGLADSD